MINDLDETIRQLILTRGNFDADSIEVSFDQPTGDWAAGLTRPTINCYCYDIRENLELRSAEWLVERDKKGQASKRLAPRRYNLSYLITVWTQNQVEDEHAILWRVLGALASESTIPAEICQGSLAEQPFPIKTQTAQPSIAIESLPDLWGVMENQLRPSINYVVTVAMEREISFTGPLVFTKRVQVLQRTDLPVRGDEILQIAGIVHRDGEKAEPVAGAQITLVETGQRVQSDHYGRYTFPNIAAGTYHVRVIVGESTTEHTLVVPAQDHDTAHYDLVI